jgi:hypothetical protein
MMTLRSIHELRVEKKLALNNSSKKNKSKKKKEKDVYLAKCLAKIFKDA